MDEQRVYLMQLRYLVKDSIYVCVGYDSLRSDGEVTKRLHVLQPAHTPDQSIITHKLFNNIYIENLGPILLIVVTIFFIFVLT